MLNFPTLRDPSTAEGYVSTLYKILLEKKKIIFSIRAHIYTGAILQSER